MKITIIEKSDFVPLHYPTWFRASISSVTFSLQCSLSGAHICIWVSWSSDQGAFPCGSSFSVRGSNSSQRIPCLWQWLMLLVCKGFHWSGSFETGRSTWTWVAPFDGLCPWLNKQEIPCWAEVFFTLLLLSDCGPGVTNGLQLLLFEVPCCDGEYSFKLWCRGMACSFPGHPESK